MNILKFEEFLKSINLGSYREKYRPIKIVEMDLPKNIQAIAILYEIYWDKKLFIDYDQFYEKYLDRYENNLEDFRKKIMMCERCFYFGLPARIYRTWASLITQIHAGYVAESVFGKGSIEMSAELDHLGADFRANYKGIKINFQVKKETRSREVRVAKQTNKIMEGLFYPINYKVPTGNIFENPTRKDGTLRKAYKEFIENKNLKRFDNGFVIFTPKIFLEIKNKIDEGVLKP